MEILHRDRQKNQNAENRPIGTPPIRNVWSGGDGKAQSPLFAFSQRATTTYCVAARHNRPEPSYASANGFLVAPSFSFLVSSWHHFNNLFLLVTNVERRKKNFAVSGVGCDPLCLCSTRGAQSSASRSRRGILGTL
jgi:hypothetical protein